ncbi:PHP family Zn ribbon phosphoesterase [Paenibacillus sp. 1182]|uniref:hypothetical protein n=1 Tax=Paenibacillus sp. 1182 TaxID=2806565 RepID=UPI001AEA639E|nr:hypothetical protein [Paenibacillus sp. 1182]MBP1309213.1 PHP family Zn ribbon phosphoesterase [Paenibacillus sp. 1182]
MKKRYASDLRDIQKEFGEEITSLVAYNIEDKSKTWEERKAHTIEQSKKGTLEQKALVVVDKYANLLEMIENYQMYADYMGIV